MLTSNPKCARNPARVRSATPATAARRAASCRRWNGGGARAGDRGATSPVSRNRL
jgi:hypothetical protein